MIELTIQGMSCRNCVKHVREALEQVPGVSGVLVSLEDGRAEVEGSASPEALLAAIAEEGYEGRLKG